MPVCVPQAVYNQAWESGSKIRGGRSDASLAEQIQFRLSANLPRVSANLTLDRGLTAEGSEAPSAKRGGYGDEQKVPPLPLPPRRAHFPTPRALPNAAGDSPLASWHANRLN